MFLKRTNLEWLYPGAGKSCREGVLIAPVPALADGRRGMRNNH